ncbi:hypothetical protein G7046_g88 [Stylonectria norvegica]|nr:hypothetical protein G7046_g88 [Stylonectria norvegica]
MSNNQEKPVQNFEVGELEAPQGLLSQQQQQHQPQHQQGYAPPSGGLLSEQQHHAPGQLLSEQQQVPSQQQNFPPPPPGPPPGHGQPQQHQQDFPPHPTGQQQYSQQHDAPPAYPNPLSGNPVYPNEKSGEHKLEQHSLGEQHPAEQRPVDQSYAIPQYNPAAPVFAPPPTNEPVHPAQHDPAYTTTPVASSSTPATTHTPHVAAHTTQPADEHAHKKSGWSEKFSQLGLKAAAPINSLAHKLGSQSFLPETLDKECDKAAATLRTFCKKGVYADPGSGQPPTSTDPKATETSDGIIDPTKQKPKSRVLVTIPPKVISKAVGLAIFTTLRAGFNVSGATGSGILIARLPDGSKEALAAFTNTRVSLGSDLAVVAGPYGAGGAVEFGTAVDNDQEKRAKRGETPVTAHDTVSGTTSGTAPATYGTTTGTTSGHASSTEAGQHQTLKPQGPDKNSHRRSLSASTFKPVFSYVKSRGFYAGIQIDGTVVVERKDANAAFYGERVSVERIIKGEIPPQGPVGMWPAGAHGLHEALKGAEAGALKSIGKEGVATTPVSAGVPGVSVPGTGAAPGQSTFPSGGTEQPPAYVNDGVQRPVGDYKYQ